MSKTEWLMPAAQVVKICGGINKTAEIVGIHRSGVNRWLLPVESGGTGGLVPISHAQTLLAAAPVRNIPLRPEHFFAIPANAVGT